MIMRCASCAVFAGLPLAAISAVAPSASAATINVGAPATASCTASGGKDVFEYPVGIPGSSSSYVPPSVNNGQVITVDHIHLSCTSPQVPHQTFDGTARGIVTITDPSDSPSQFYNCGYYTNDIPPAGGTLKGKLTVTWTSPVHGVTFVPNTSMVKYDSVVIGTTTVSGTEYETYSFPGPGTVSVSGAFPGTDSGGTSTMTNLSQDTWTELDAACYTVPGVGAIHLASGSATFG